MKLLFLFFTLLTSSALVAVTPPQNQAPQKVVISFVPVMDANNPADPTTQLGSVATNFQIGKYDVTAAQYARFLNAVASKSDPYKLYNDKMSSDVNVASISRQTNADGSFTYSTKPNTDQFPIVHVTWFTASRFCNWMHNNQPVGDEGATTTETGAYTLNGATNDVNGTATIAKSDYCALNDGAKFFLPTENQWYKAAYYNTIKKGTNYYNYPTSDAKFDAAPGNSTKSIPNQANYFITTNIDDSKTWPWYWNYQYSNGGKPPFLTLVGEFMYSPGPYGTFDMGGNVFQWTSNPGVTGSRVIRGGSWKHQLNDELNRKTCVTANPGIAYDFVGFRLAAPAN